MTRVTNVSFTHASRAATECGLLGWVAFDLDGTVRVDDVSLRRTLDGRLALSFPSRVDRRGFRRSLLRPTCDRARRAIERGVLAELGLEGES